jgi:hypothetical protein
VYVGNWKRGGGKFRKRRAGGWGKWGVVGSGPEKLEKGNRSEKNSKKKFLRSKTFRAELWFLVFSETFRKKYRVGNISRA